MSRRPTAPLYVWSAVDEGMFHETFAWLGKYVEGRSGHKTDAETHVRAVELYRWYRHELPELNRDFGDAVAIRPRIYPSRIVEIKDEKLGELHAVQDAIAWPDLKRQ